MSEPKTEESSPGTPATPEQISASLRDIADRASVIRDLVDARHSAVVSILQSLDASPDAGSQADVVSGVMAPLGSWSVLAESALDAISRGPSEGGLIIEGQPDTTEDALSPRPFASPRDAVPAAADAGLLPEGGATPVILGDKDRDNDTPLTRAEDLPVPALQPESEAAPEEQSLEVQAVVETAAEVTAPEATVVELPASEVRPPEAVTPTETPAEP